MSAKVLRLPRRPGPEPDLSDEALAAAAATGDRAAVGALFDRFQPLVTRYLARVIGGGPEVEDLVQATFVVVAKGRSSFDGRSKASTWLLGIATNVARHHRRAIRRRHRLVERVTQSEVARPTGLDEQVDARRAVAIVEEVLAAQPEERRMAFVLCEIEGRSARQAAEILSTSETAIWKRVSDTRRALKRALGNDR